MDGFSAAPDEIRAYGNVAAGAATHITTAGGLDLAANVAALTPVFGAIGADFVATFAATQTAHARSVAALANHYAGTGTLAHAIAAAYDATDHANSSVLGNACSALGDDA